jgi:tripartite-type tricarboxylate transporter receptor subunit TctC
VKLARRTFLRLAGMVGALPAMLRSGQAQAWPARPVRIVVPFAPAGTTDIVARLMAQWLSERLGQQFVVENRPGGAGNVGTESVIRATPDGYTLLSIDTSAAINATLFNNKLNFDFVHDIAPVANIVRLANVMVVNPSFPATTVPEFIAYARANPGKIAVASAGIGTPNHLAGEMFKAMAGLDMTHVPYRGGGPAIADLLGGQVQVTFAVVTTAIEYIRTGKLRALALNRVT